MQKILALEELHRRVMPFLLRREKSDVLRELPPKVGAIRSAHFDIILLHFFNCLTLLICVRVLEYFEGIFYCFQCLNIRTYQVIVDVPCPLSDLQATLYRRVCASAAAACSGGADSSGVAPPAAVTPFSLVDPLGIGENREGCMDGVDEEMTLNMDEPDHEQQQQLESHQQQQHVSASHLSGRQTANAWRGLKSLRALSQLCTHPCLAVQTPASSNKTTAPNSACQEHPRYQDW